MPDSNGRDRLKPPNMVDDARALHASEVIISQYDTLKRDRLQHVSARMREGIGPQLLLSFFGS